MKIHHSYPHPRIVPDHVFVVSNTSVGYLMSRSMASHEHSTHPTSIGRSQTISQTRTCHACHTYSNRIPLREVAVKQYRKLKLLTLSCSSSKPSTNVVLHSTTFYTSLTESTTCFTNYASEGLVWGYWLLCYV